MKKSLKSLMIAIIILVLQTNLIVHIGKQNLQNFKSMDTMEIKCAPLMK